MATQHDSTPPNCVCEEALTSGSKPEHKSELKVDLAPLSWTDKGGDEHQSDIKRSKLPATTPISRLPPVPASSDASTSTISSIFSTINTDSEGPVTPLTPPLSEKHIPDNLRSQKVEETEGLREFSNGFNTGSSFAYPVSKNSPLCPLTPDISSVDLEPKYSADVGYLGQREAKQLYGSPTAAKEIRRGKSKQLTETENENIENYLEESKGYFDLNATELARNETPVYKLCNEIPSLPLVTQSPPGLTFNDDGTGFTYDKNDLASISQNNSTESRDMVESDSKLPAADLSNLERQSSQPRTIPKGTTPASKPQVASVGNTAHDNVAEISPDNVPENSLGSYSDSKQRRRSGRISDIAAKLERQKEQQKQKPTTPPSKPPQKNSKKGQKATSTPKESPLEVTGSLNSAGKSSRKNSKPDSRPTATPMQSPPDANVNSNSAAKSSQKYKYPDPQSTTMPRQSPLRTNDDLDSKTISSLHSEPVASSTPIKEPNCTNGKLNSAKTSSKKNTNPGSNSKQKATSFSSINDNQTSKADCKIPSNSETNQKPYSPSSFDDYKPQKSDNDLKLEVLRVLRRENHIKQSKPPPKGSKQSSAVKNWEYKKTASGYLYVFECKSFPEGHVKIGVTKVTPEERLKQWERQCGNTVSHIPDPYDTKFAHYEIAELLIHAELWNKRKKYVCKCRKLTTHEEWFKIEQEEALKVVEKWRRWIIEMRPYKNNGSLRACWIWKYDQCMNANPIDLDLLLKFTWRETCDCCVYMLSGWMETLWGAAALVMSSFELVQFGMAVAFLNILFGLSIALCVIAVPALYLLLWYNYS